MKKLFLLLSFLILSQFATAGTPIKLMAEYDQFCTSVLSADNIPMKWLNTSSTAVGTTNALNQLTSAGGGYLLGWQGTWTLGAPYWSTGQGYAGVTPIPGDTTHFFGNWWNPSVNHTGTTRASDNLFKALRDSCHAHNVYYITELHAEGQSTSTTAFNTLMVASTARIDSAMNVLVSFLVGNGVDGLDINIEYPTTAGQAGMLELVNYIHAHFSPFLVTFTIDGHYNSGSIPAQTGDCQISPNIIAACDGVWIEEYDDYWTSRLTFNDALYPANSSYAPSPSSGQSASASYVSYTMGRVYNVPGVDSANIFPLFAFGESRSFTYTGTDSVSSLGTYQNYANWGTCYNAGVANPSGKHFNAVAKHSYVANNGTWYAYDDSLTQYYLMQYAYTYGTGLHTMGLWDLFFGNNLGSYSNSLQAIAGGMTQQQIFAPMYYMYQNAIALAGNSTAPNSPAVPILTTPANNATNIQIAGGINFSWTPGQYDTLYSFALYQNSSGTGSAIWSSPGFSGATITVPFGIFNYNTVYSWRVAGLTQYTNLNSGFSQAFTFTTGSNTAAIPNKPILTYPSYGATGITVPDSMRWIRGANAVSYTLQVTPDTTSAQPTFTQTGITDSNYVNYVPLSVGVNYWRVKAVNSNGDSGYTVYGKFTVASQVINTTVANSYYIDVVGSDGHVHRILLNGLNFQLVPNTAAVLTPDTLGCTLFIIQGSTNLNLMLHDRSTYVIGGTSSGTYMALDMSNSTNITKSIIPNDVVPYAGTYTLGSGSTPFLGTYTNSLTLVNPAGGGGRVTMNADPAAIDYQTIYWITGNGTNSAANANTDTGVTRFDLWNTKIPNARHSDTASYANNLIGGGGSGTTIVVSGVSVGSIDTIAAGTGISISQTTGKTTITATGATATMPNIGWILFDNFLTSTTSSTINTNGYAGGYGSYNWNYHGIGSTGRSAFIGGWDETGTVGADSGVFGGLFVIPDTGISTLGTAYRGAWITPWGSGGTGGNQLQMKIVGEEMIVRFNINDYGSTTDSLVGFAGVIDINGVTTAFAVDTCTHRNYLGFEWGGEGLTSVDSIYAVACNGTTVSKWGLLAATAPKWYKCWYIINADGSVTFYATSQVSNYQTVISKTMTTNLPAYNVAGTPVMGAWQSDRTVQTKNTVFGYYGIGLTVSTIR